MSKNKESASNAGLVGKYFHSLKDGKVEWQGVIVSRPEYGMYLVQLFSWIDGSPNIQRIIPIEYMNDWMFYDDDEAMKLSYERGIASRMRS